MLYESNLSDEQRAKLRRLAWSALTRGVVSFFVAVGQELGKRLIERVAGDDEEDDGDDDEETPV